MISTILDESRSHLSTSERPSAVRDQRIRRIDPSRSSCHMSKQPLWNRLCRRWCVVFSHSNKLIIFSLGYLVLSLFAQLAKIPDVDPTRMRHRRASSCSTSSRPELDPVRSRPSSRTSLRQSQSPKMNIKPLHRRSRDEHM